MKTFILLAIPFSHVSGAEMMHFTFKKEKYERFQCYTELSQLIPTKDVGYISLILSFHPPLLNWNWILHQFLNPNFPWHLLGVQSWAEKGSSYWR